MSKENKTIKTLSKRKTVRLHDQKVARGDGGETHQTASEDAPLLTTQQGTPVADDQNSLKIRNARSCCIGGLSLS